MNRYVDPKNDVAFRKLFGAEERKYLLINLLNALLRLDAEHAIKQVEVFKSPNNADPTLWQSSLLSIRCTDNRNIQYLVEIHNKRSSHFKKRAQYFAAQCYAEHLSAPSNFSALLPVVMVCFSEHTLFNDKDSYVSCHQILDVQSYDNDLEDFSFIFIELSKFLKREEELGSDADKWLYFFKHAHFLGEIPGILREGVFVDAFSILEESQWNEIDLAEYKSAALALIDDSDAYQGSLAKGMAEREQRGVEMGKAIGEHETKVGIAKVLIAKGFSVPEISEMTGLSAEEISRIHKL